MRRKKNIYIFIFVSSMFIVLSIGYAAINNINLVVNGTGNVVATQSNFNVKFLDVDGHRPAITPGSPNTVNVLSDTIATFDVSTLSKKGDTAVATIDVKNESNTIGTRIGLSLSNSNSDYFKVTEHIADSELQVGDITTVTITIEMLKTPISADETTSISAILIANPIDETTATGSDSKEIKSPSFADDSWQQIAARVRNNKTDVYEIGDTKEIKMDIDNNGIDETYTVRLANKSDHDYCDNSIYSQTACGFVVEFVDIITNSKYNNSRTNAGGYPATILYNYMRETLFDKLPSDLKNEIATTRVVSGYGCNSGWDSSNKVCSDPESASPYITYDKLYLLSAKEVYGLDDNLFYDISWYATEQLDYYDINFVTYTTAGQQGTKTNYDKAIKELNGTAKAWWFRSPVMHSKESFAYVGTSGEWKTTAANGNYGIAPAFRIAQNS